MTTDKLVIATTVNRKDKADFKIFCTQNDLREGNTLRSLLVWLKQLSQENQKKFFTKYLSRTQYGRGDKTSTLHVYFSSQEELDEIQQMAREIQGRILSIKLSYTTLLISLIRWLQKLSKDSLLAFKKRYYLPGLNNTLESIEHQAQAEKKVTIDYEGKTNTRWKNKKELEEAKV